MNLSIIRLELARDPAHPSGSAGHGYEFVAPLGANGHIDAEAWRKMRNRCRVRRFWEGDPDEMGHLIHRRGGSWAFHVAGDPDEDEPGYKFDAHVFKQGEYVSLRETDGELLTFQVVSVRPAPER
jgi:hypothetical protein